jgi:hypothetical protein
MNIGFSGVAAYLGAGTTCGVPPGTSSVLVPLPLLISSPSLPLPGNMAVATEPAELVTVAGPRGVTIEVPASGNPGRPKNDGVAKAGDTPIAAAKASGMIIRLDI